MDLNPFSVVVDRCRHRSTPRRLWCRLALVLLVVLSSSVVLRCLSSNPSGPPPPPSHRLADDSPRRVQRRSPPSSPAAAGAVVNASDVDVMRARRVNTVREEILKKLRMQSAPNVTLNGRELRTMKRILNFSESESQTANAEDDDDDDEEEGAGPVIVIVQSRAVPVAGFNASTACYFKFPDDLTESSQVMNASLGVHLRPTNHSDRSSSSLRLLVRKNIRHSDPVSYRRKRIQGSSRAIGGRWHTIDVKSLVQSWISEPNGNVGVTIATSDAHGQHPTTAIVQPRNSHEETLRPFIELRMKPAVGSPGGRRRQARSVGGGGMDCNENSVEQRCCRYPLTIDFEEFRWDWIMVPKRYEAFYCSGRCTQFFYRSPSRTAVQSQAAGSSSADACCAATEVAPLSIIHLNDKSPGYIHTSLPGMVVKQCGCL